MNALTSLQVSSEVPITLATMDITTNELWQYQCKAVQDKVFIPAPCGPELWSTNDEHVKEMYTRMAEDKLAFNNEGEYNLFAQFKGKPLILWPIWVEDRFGKDWVLIAWHAEESVASSGVYDWIKSYAIYDSRRIPDPDGKGAEHWPVFERGLNIQRRLEHMFSVARFKLDDDCIAKPGWCSPMAPDEVSSGERCFAAIKELLGIFTQNAIKQENWEGYPEFPRLSRWVFPYAVRVEMTGIAAWVLMATHQWNARIALECMEPNLGYQVVVDGDLRVFKPSAIFPSRPKPPFAAEDYNWREPKPEEPQKEAEEDDLYA
ncbi:hypothetical protein F4821DRAFT_247553 [Hypoxylon rubiginosum]|uniref:Uncharacterized protein n=1 Tax=Hypoxylon rubiginosum TaxID=110542 RepID=A0ACC0CPS1_9PEZI|nr:hypothetical protein F4821DRAFT_247553 [Hypoxylon rubiginosum]